MERTADEITEIERHKYFLSEKKGHDVGWEFAEGDWEGQFGEAWRNQRKSDTDQSEETSNKGNTDKQLTRTLHPSHAADASESTTPRFRIGSLLSRFFPRN